MKIFYIYNILNRILLVFKTNVMPTRIIFISSTDLKGKPPPTLKVLYLHVCMQYKNNIRWKLKIYVYLPLLFPNPSSTPYLYNGIATIIYYNNLPIINLTSKFVLFSYKLSGYDVINHVVFFIGTSRR